MGERGPGLRSDEERAKALAELDSKNGNFVEYTTADKLLVHYDTTRGVPSQPMMPDVSAGIYHGSSGHDTYDITPDTIRIYREHWKALEAQTVAKNLTALREMGGCFIFVVIAVVLYFVLSHYKVF